ncbi:hypothetical protein BX600DRAFT_449169, partial [Xylariales sp. PMI_506]
MLYVISIVMPLALAPALGCVYHAVLGVRIVWVVSPGLLIVDAHLSMIRVSCYMPLGVVTPILIGNRATAAAGAAV